MALPWNIPVVFVSVALCLIFSNGSVEGRARNKELFAHRGTIKTIQGEDGEVIDCVNIYKQPTFDHPLLKNHTIQMKPSSLPSALKGENFNLEVLQGWLKKEQCPERTIPMSRSKVQSHPRKSALFPQRTKVNEFVRPDPSHEYAQVSLVGGNYFGVHGTINVWNPATFNQEASIAQIWVLSGHEGQMNSIEAGWKIDSGKKAPSFFIYWTRDGYQSTGCYGIDCPGFVQTSKLINLGNNVIRPVSIYGGRQKEITITIYKDKQTGNWWLLFFDEPIGYWPSSIFTSLADSSTAISWGGEIVNTGIGQRHTSTQMGSGHFPNEGQGKAAFFRALGYMDEVSGEMKQAVDLVPYVTKPPCYDLKIDGRYFYFGGPGYSPQCQN